LITTLEGIIAPIGIGLIAICMAMMTTDETWNIPNLGMVFGVCMFMMGGAIRIIHFAMTDPLFWMATLV